MSSVTSEEFLWSCDLTAAKKEYSWAPQDPVKEGEDTDEEGKPTHKLLIKSAILMPTAKKDEVNIVEIESEGYNKEKVKVPILAMKGGNDLQTYVDLLVPNNAKLTLIKGEGPIHLIGSHCIDFFDNMAGEADSEGEDEEMEVSQEKGKTKDASASPIKTKSSPADSKKRKASEAGDEVDNKEKKAKPSPAKQSPAKASPAK